ncbi:hypothetical protein PYW07_008696 [Mythimna separata]|uniref:RNase H type-1 domain-containing protein n=1 Tax=Mythimna separata TaxID=271217 RepID=A0AAD8DPA1_MYTSE|nr:hypothetical protein PYW07_008696 [Mythimna separata]
MTLELIAIHQAIFYSRNQNLKRVVIFSDSKSALQHIARCASGGRGASIAYDILENIILLSKNNIEIKLQWVPAHIGLRGNEEADRVSKLAATEGTTIDYLPDHWEHIPRCKVICYNSWKQYFVNVSQKKGIWYRTIQSEPPRAPWFDDCQLNKNYVKLVLRLRSGHYPSAKFAFLMKKADSPNCRECNQIEDVQHLLMDCIRNRSERESLLRELGLNRLNVGLIQTILSRPTSDDAKKLCQLITALHQ